MGSKEIKKSEAMRKKNEEIHRLFNLPETERVIQGLFILIHYLLLFSLELN